MPLSTGSRSDGSECSSSRRRCRKNTSVDPTATIFDRGVLAQRCPCGRSRTSTSDLDVPDVVLSEPDEITASGRVRRVTPFQHVRCDVARQGLDEEGRTQLRRQVPDAR